MEIDSKLAQKICNGQGREAGINGKACSWSVSSGGIKGPLPNGHTCIEQTNNCKDRAHRERGQPLLSRTGDTGVPEK